MSLQRFILPLFMVVALIAAAGLAFGEGPAATAESPDSPEAKAETDGEAAEEKSEEPANILLRARVDDHAFSVVVEPGSPRVDRRVGLRLELMTIPETLDPTFGDRVPVREASLVAVLTSPGENGEVRRQTLHPHGGAGSYGMHWTPEREGLWRLSFEQRGAELPEASFRIGVGVDTPPQDDPSLGRGPGGPSRVLGGLERGQRGGGVVGPLTPIAAGPTASTVMSAMSAPSTWLVGALSEETDQETAREATAALIAESRKLAGTVPERHAASGDEYDRLARELVSRLETLSSTVEEGEMTKARSEWRGTLDQTCAQCHVKYWWGVSPDLSAFPNVGSRP